MEGKKGVIIQIGVSVNSADTTRVSESVGISLAQTPEGKVELDYLQFCKILPI